MLACFAFFTQYGYPRFVVCSHSSSIAIGIVVSYKACGCFSLSSVTFLCRKKKKSLASEDDGRDGGA